MNSRAGQQPLDAAAPLLLRLFGSPRLLRGQEPLATGSRKALAVLALLALDGAQSRDALAQRLWPDADDAAARRNLRRELFRLREIDVPVHDAAGGLLQLGTACAVDVLRFRGALAEGDEAAALAAGGTAALEGLDGLVDARFDDWLREQRAALARQRLQAHQALARSRTDRGDADGALAAWQALLDEDPCHEPALGAVMDLLARRGEPAAALARYDRAAAALRAELGVAPSAALQRQAQTLRQAPLAPRPARPGPAAAPGAAAPAPAAPPLPPGLPWVPRPADEARVAAALARAGRVVLHGEPGCGKTRLATACAAQRGPWVHLPCRPDDGGRPFSTLVRVLRTLHAAAPGRALPEWVQRELAQLMPELGTPPRALEAAEAGQRLLDAARHALRALLAEPIRTAVVDDWQWCDADSAPLLQELGLQGPACLVVHRSAQLAPEPLAAMHRQLELGQTRSVALEGLDEAGTQALVHARLGSGAPPGFARRLHAGTAGHPLFVIETLNLLHERGLLGDRTAPAAPAELPVPASVRDTVLARVRAQGEAARRVLEAASLLDGRFDAALLGGVTAAGTDEVLAVLEHAQAARLLQADARGCRFAHELLRQCVADSLSPPRRQLLHARLADRLAERGADPAQVAAQHEQAGQAAAAVPWRLQAGDAALRVHALAEAAAQHRAALADGPGADDAVHAHLALLRLHQRQADAPAVSAAAAAALAASAHASPVWRVRARLASAEDWGRGNRAAEGLALLDALAGDLDAVPGELRAEVDRHAARLLRWMERHDDAAAREAQAIARLERTPGAAAALGAVFDEMTRRALSGRRPAEAEQAAQRAVAALEGADEPGRLAQALVLLGVARLHAHGPEGVQPLFERAQALAAQARHVPAQRAAILNLVKLHTDAGRSAEAQALIEEGLALAPGFEHAMAEQAFAQARYFVHYLRGQVEAAEAGAEQLLTLARRQPDRDVLLRSIVMVVDLYLMTDRPARAQMLLDEAAQACATAPTYDEWHLKQAWLCLQRGQLAAAEAALAAAGGHGRARHEGHALAAWLGAALALARGDGPTARARLAAVDRHGDMPAEARTLLLLQHLACARAEGRADATLQDEARQWLASGRAPALEAAQLRRALDSPGRPGTPR